MIFFDFTGNTVNSGKYLIVILWFIEVHYKLSVLSAVDVMSLLKWVTQIEIEISNKIIVIWFRYATFLNLDNISYRNAEQGPGRTKQKIVLYTVSYSDIVLLLSILV